ncbi:MAG TPA: thiamine pyrophosphate-dependent enzyme [Vicinamibacteria bacterium]|nr:thiamine pyrophosphate-dependent enzyme [Vicinamibacteria bacterium]
MTKDELLAPLARLRGPRVVVTTMGLVRPWARHSDSPLDFASADSAMGHAADFALGIALAQPARQVVCLNGDGSMLMTLGTLVTIVQSGARNLVLFVAENGTYEVTGNQKVPGAGRVDFAAMARAAGFPRAERFRDAATYAEALPGLLEAPGPVCLVVDVEPGDETPLGRGPRQDASYLRPSLADSARALRAALLR